MDSCLLKDSRNAQIVFAKHLIVAGSKVGKSLQGELNGLTMGEIHELNEFSRMDIPKGLNISAPRVNVGYNFESKWVCL